MAAKFSSQSRKQRPSQGELGRGHDAEVHQQADSKRKGNEGPKLLRAKASGTIHSVKFLEFKIPVQKQTRTQTLSVRDPKGHMSIFSVLKGSSKHK